MAFSQNGLRARDYSLIASYTVPGTSVRVSLRKGDVSVVLLWLAEQFHRKVQPLRQEDTGGYNPRSIIGGHTLSNHASGTAIDVRWQDHPIGKRNTFNVAQRATIRGLLKQLDGVVRWGGDYKGRPDDMHFEVVAPPAAVKKVADKIRKGQMTSKPVTPAKNPTSVVNGLTPAEALTFQRNMNKIFPAYESTPLSVDGVVGPNTVKAIKEFQSRAGLKADGEVGPKTRAALKAHHVL